MSCILYSRASYVNLAHTSAFRALFNETLRSTYDSPATFADALFELNARAYNDRYSRNDESLDAEIQAERERDESNHEFEQFITAHAYATPKAYAALWELLGRIEYQCSDASNFHELETCWHLTWLRNAAARQMVAAITNYQPPPPVKAPCAALRDALNTITRAADDSDDFESASVIGRAANRAYALLDKLEGKEEDRPRTIRAA